MVTYKTISRAETTVILILINGETRGSFITQDEDELTLVKTLLENGGIKEDALSYPTSNTKD